MDKELVDLLNDLNKAFNSRNVRDLRDVTSTSTSKLAITQEKVYFSVAILSYILSKMLEKSRYARAAKFFSICSQEFKSAVDAAKQGRTKDVQSAMDHVLVEVGTVEQVDRRFIHDVIEKSRTKIASILYAQGLSLDVATSLTGAPQMEVLRYSGTTMMADRFGRTLSAEERLKNARKILK